MIFENYHVKIAFPDYLQEKIFQIQFNDDESISKIISYFPFSDLEREKIISLQNEKSFNAFQSIFTDTISDEEWNKNKEKIKKRFNDELFDIDKSD